MKNEERRSRGFQTIKQTKNFWKEQKFGSIIFFVSLPKDNGADNGLVVPGKIFVLESENFCPILGSRLSAFNANSKKKKLNAERLI